MCAMLRREGHVVGRKRIQRLMRLMGLQAQCPQPQAAPFPPCAGTQDLPVSDEVDPGRSPELGVVCGYHLYSYETGIYVSGGGHGLAQSQGVLLRTVQLAGCRLLHEYSQKRVAISRHSRSVQYRSGCPVHFLAVDRDTQR